MARYHAEPKSNILLTNDNSNDKWYSNDTIALFVG